MSYFGTAFETTAGSLESKQKLELGLKEASISINMKDRSFGVEPNGKRFVAFITGQTSEEMKIPVFIHPCLVKGKDVDLLFVDLRLFKTTGSDYFSPKEFEDAVRNKSEYAFTKSRAVLNHLWLVENLDSFKTKFSFAGYVYAAWLSQAVAKAYALDLNDQYRIMALSMYFYHLLFSAEKKLTGDALETAVIHTIKATKLPAAEIYELFESLDSMVSISDYCEAVKKVASNVRLRDFNLAVLLMQIRNTWYATNSKEILAVALEHPPTWIAIVSATMLERSYRSSPLYKIIELQAKRGMGDEFKMNYADLYRTSCLVLESVSNSLEIRDF